MERRLLGCVLGLFVLLGAGCGDDSSPTDTAGEADAVEETEGDVVPDGDGEIEEDVLPETGDGDGEVEEEAETVEEADAEADGDATPTVCETYCGPVVAAGCTAGPPDEAACLTGCAALVAACGTEFGELAACAGETPTIACDASGMPYAEGCEAEQAALLGCMSGGACGGYCGQAAVAGCVDGPASFAECSSTCRDSETLCAAEFDALSTCAGDSYTVACDSMDRASISGCDAEFDALMQCTYIDPCTAVCTPAVAAGCTVAPPDVPSCVQSCADFASNSCVTELHDLFDCAGDSPVATCDASDMPVITGCEAETAVFSGCGEP